MNTVRLNIKITEIPPSGEVWLFSSYNPSFWKNQPTLETIVVREANQEYSFKSTNEVWVITRCKDCTSASPGNFKIEYQKKTVIVEVEEFPDWSMIITIIIGFSMMFIAFLYFEWRLLFWCIGRCQEKCCGKKSSSQIGFVNNQEYGHGLQNEENSINDSAEEQLEDQIISNINRIVDKNK